MGKKILARVEDLMFRAKIDAAARHLSVEVEFLPDVGAIAAVPVTEAAALFVELTPAAVEAIRKLKGTAAGRALPVVGFFSHVDKELAENARAAGVDRVLARSVFSESLPDMIMELTAGRELKLPEEPELPEE